MCSNPEFSMKAMLWFIARYILVTLKPDGRADGLIGAHWLIIMHYACNTGRGINTPRNERAPGHMPASVRNMVYNDCGWCCFLLWHPPACMSNVAAH